MRSRCSRQPTPTESTYAQRLIEALLSARGSNSANRKLRILALRCEAAASSHLPHRTRARIRKLAEVPATDSHEARQIAALGEEAVPHLAYRPKVEAPINAAAVHCLRLIGTPAARATMHTYLATESLVVAEELIHDLNPLENAAVLTAAQNPSAWERVHPKSSPLFAISLRSPISPTCNHSTSRARRSPKPPRSPISPTCNGSTSRARKSRTPPRSPSLSACKHSISGVRGSRTPPAGNLIDLRELNLTETQVADAAPLASLTNLLRLYVLA